MILLSEMHFSNYIKTYPHEGKLILFSTRRASVIVLEREIHDSIKDGSLPHQDSQTLSRLGFLTKDVVEEKSAMFRFLAEANVGSSHLNTIVVLNLDCNLSCRYCYQGTLKGRSYMDRKTADLLIRFIINSLTPQKKSLNIDFYGGEPLLSLKLVKYISTKVRASVENRNIRYTFTLVTNGTLLTRSVAEELAPLGLKGVKITLDGIRSNHDKYRPYKSGAGSFDRIIRNILDTCDVIKTGIGGNFERSNYKTFPLLLDYLADEGLTPERISSVKFDPITKTHNEQAPADFRDIGCESINEPWLIEAGFMLREEILRRGYNTPKVTPALCMIDVRDDFVVNNDGTLYKCPALIASKGFEAGHLRTGPLDYRESHNLDNWKNEECLNCEYLPLCFGGCRYMKYLRDGNMEGVDCKKPYLDATLETFLKQDIKYRMKPQK
jgi:uncharacterized protein